METDKRIKQEHIKDKNMTPRKKTYKIFGAFSKCKYLYWIVYKSSQLSPI